jgi:2-keto-4-pentenoate hydratase/2-oxohepta-3-ene-1,7-dioic acid hydratase in catechol pathway
MSHVIAAPASASVPVAGAAGATFPVHRIYCVGRNYVEHAKEMGFTGREPPFFFMKPADTVLAVAEGEVGRMPSPARPDPHHEKNILPSRLAAARRSPRPDAMRHVRGPRSASTYAARPAGRSEEARPAVDISSHPGRRSADPPPPRPHRRRHAHHAEVNGGGQQSTIGKLI